MNIALCLHGLFSSTHDHSSNGFDGYEYIKKHILSKGNVDVFVHSWEIEQRNLIEDLYQPKMTIFESQKDFNSLVNERGLNTLRGCPRSPASVLSHLYSVAEAVKLPYTQNTTYDIVVKARFDLGRINRNTSGPGRGNPYPVQCINFVTDINSDTLYMANWNHFHMGPADMWFYGDSTIMKSFTTVYNDLHSAMHIGSDFHTFATTIENNEGDLSNSIAFYKWWMINNGLWEKRITLDTVWE